MASRLRRPVHMLCLSLCLSAAAALAPASPRLISPSRTTKIIAQQPYYYDDHTRAFYNEAAQFPAAQYGSSWECGDDVPAQQNLYGPQVLCCVAPASGVYNDYYLRNGDHVMVGRYDMIEQSPYVSRQQCLVRVDADGTATITSMGKPPTGVLGADGYWYPLYGGQTYNLENGQQISLDIQNPNNACFTVYLQQEQQQPYFHDQQQQGGYGYPQQQQQQGMY